VRVVFFLATTSNQKIQDCVAKLSLTELELPTSPPLITLALPVRHLGVTRNYFERYLRELIEKTHDLSRIEIVIKVDTDDDLPWFCKMLDRYGTKVRLRIFVTPRSNSYKGLHHYYQFLINKRHSKSQIWILQSADAEILVDQWDEILLKELATCEKKYFICTDANFEESISVKGPYPLVPEPVYWIRGTLFPIISCSLLDVLMAESRRHNGWTSLNIPGFLGDIIRHCHSIHGLNLHCQSSRLFREYWSESWDDNPAREPLRTKTLLDFFSDSTQAIHLSFASEINRCVTRPREGETGSSSAVSKTEKQSLRANTVDRID
jgi:hypothetical protein